MIVSQTHRFKSSSRLCTLQTRMTDTQFKDAMTRVNVLWEKSQSDTQQLREALHATEQSLLEQRNINLTLSNQNNELSHNLSITQKEVARYMKKVQEAEDDQKQFTKVSHIINMERETTHLKQQIAILERRVAFYQNQCNELKEQKNATTVTDYETQGTQTHDGPTSSTGEAHNALHCDISKEQDNVNCEVVDESNMISCQDTDKDEDNTTECEKDADSEGEDMNVVEKKIKGVVYYVSDDGDIYVRNDDESIGELKGKMELLSSGKTKVKWFK